MEKVINYLTEDIFPILILKIPNFLDNDLCTKICDYYKNSLILKNHHYFTGDAKITHSVDSDILNDIINNITGCESIKKNISSALELYENKTGFDKAIISNSWINFQNKGSSLYDHTHAHSFITGCLYLNVDELSNPICFQNPNLFVEYMDSNVKTKYTEHVSSFNISIGDLFIFPSWIKHGSNGKKNLSNNRVSIAFNTRVV